MNTTSNYVISMKKNEFSTRNREVFLGKVRSNFLGTEFILFDEGQNPKKCKDTSLIRTQLGIVYYESHIMQNKGPRKMKVLLPKVGDHNIPKVFQPLHSNEGI
jgi:tubby-related protein 1